MGKAFLASVFYFWLLLGPSRCCMECSGMASKIRRICTVDTVDIILIVFPQPRLRLERSVVVGIASTTVCLAMFRSAFLFSDQPGHTLK